MLARERGLKNNFVSNGFISEAPLREIAPLLDAVNIDLKFLREASYRRISRARLQPVLDAIRLYHELGVWVEVTTLVITGGQRLGRGVAADRRLHPLVGGGDPLARDRQLPRLPEARPPLYRRGDHPPRGLGPK